MGYYKFLAVLNKKIIIFFSVGSYQSSTQVLTYFNYCPLLSLRDFILNYNNF